MANYVKFLTNIPETITFNFDTPSKNKETGEDFKINQWGSKQFNYGVVWKGLDSYLTASETLHNILKNLNGLRGKTIQILKYEDGKRNLWKILDAQGNELSVSQQQNNQNTHNIPPQTQKPATEPSVKPQAISDDFKQSIIAGFKVRDEIIKKLSNRIHVCEMALIDFNGEKMTYKGAEFHSATEPKEEIPEVFQPKDDLEIENPDYNEAEEHNKPDYFKKMYE